MTTVTYELIQRGVCDLLGWDPDNLDTRQFRVIRGAVSRALGHIWNRYWWSDLLRVEERAFRPDYDAATTYAVGTEVWFVGPGKYYQALQETTGNDPATLSGTTWTENSAYWAECAAEYSGSDWSASVTYAIGDIVRWVENGRHYQRITNGTGEEPSAAAAWGILTAFDAYVDRVAEGETPIGRVRAVYDRDPRIWAGARRLDWANSQRGIEVYANEGTVWVEFLLRPHRFTGDLYDASALYTESTAEEMSGDTTVETTTTMATDTSGEGYQGIAALRARTLHTTRQLAYLDYVASPGDGGGGWFLFDASSTDADDGVDTLKPNDISGANPGRWKRRN